MNVEAQRIAIARACRLQGESGCHTNDDQLDRHWEILPDYLNDLNAMHEAEKALRRDQWPDYYNNLCVIYDPVEDISVTHATAAQRAEAFCRTLGLWKEQPQEQPA